MKNMKLMLMVSLLVLLAACGSKPMPEEDKQNGAPQVKNEIPAEAGDVKAEVKVEEGSEEANLTLRNSSDKEAGTGTAFVLEKWTDGKWEKVNNDQMFTEQMIMVKAGENYDQKVDMKEQEAGTYRVSKEFFVDEKKNKIAVVFQKK
jgi:major membrane immunogen (membrane-anchored lipoprotein)